MDVYKIQVSMGLAGSISPELKSLLKDFQAIDKTTKGVEKNISRWVASIDKATASVGKLNRAMAGVKVPKTPFEIELKALRDIQAVGAEMAGLRKTTQGVGSAARGVTRSIDGWAGKINTATTAMQRLRSAAGQVSLGVPAIGGSGPGGGGRQRGGATRHSSHRRGSEGRRFGEGEGSHLAGMVGVTGGLTSLDWLVSQGAGGVREDIRAKNAGLTPTEIAVLRIQAGELSATYPSQSKLDAREQGRLLVPNVGDFDTASKLLPEYILGKVALQTVSGVEQGAKDMEAMARFVDLVGRSRSPGDTRKLIDGFVRSRQLDAEAVKAGDYVNFAQSAGSAGKALSTDFMSTVLPALFMQQGGSRTGTDVASAFQNTILGRGTDESILAQFDQGLRVGTKFKVGKNGKRKLISDGNYVDEALYSSNLHEWNKKHVVPRMVSIGMLPEAYARGDYSQDLTDEQRVAGTKYIAQLFSNRRGSSLHTMDVLEIGQIEAIIKRLKSAGGTASVLADQKVDPAIGARSVVTQLGNMGSAFAAPAIPGLTEEANRLAKALGATADYLEKHQTTAQTGFGLGTAAVGGTAAMGTAALLGAGLTLAGPVSIAIGAGVALTIAGLTIPWGDLRRGIGIDDELWNNGGRVGRSGGHIRAQRALTKVGPYDFTAGLPNASVPGSKAMPALPAIPPAAEQGWWDWTKSQWRGNGRVGRAGGHKTGAPPPGIPSLLSDLPPIGGSAIPPAVTPGPQGGLAPGAASEIQKAGVAIGQAGSASATAASSIAGSADGFKAAAGAADAAKAAAQGASSAMQTLAGQISSLSSIRLPIGSAAPAAGGRAGPAAPAIPYEVSPPGRRSFVPPPRSSAPIQVATNLQLNGRSLGRAVTQHQVASADFRNGTGSFEGYGLMTPVGQPMPVHA